MPVEHYYTTKDGVLQTIGSGPKERNRAIPAGCRLHIGVPPGFTFNAPPFPEACWHVDRQAWVDLRTPEQLNEQAVTNVTVARRAAYPPLSDLADALYWQVQGDNSKMEAYLAACAAVKVRYPKLN